MHIKNDIDLLFKQLENSGTNHVAPWVFKALGDF